MPQDPETEKFLASLQTLGETEVRLALSTNRYGEAGHRRQLAQQWLDDQERAHALSASKEDKAYASRQAKAAERAAAAAESASAMATRDAAAAERAAAAADRAATAAEEQARTARQALIMAIMATIIAAVALIVSIFGPFHAVR